MEHSWILLLAMIGHVLCVYADRLLLCTPGGQFGFSDMKDNARMARLFVTKPESDPLRSIVLGTLAMFLQFLPLVVMGVLAELVRAAMKYNWTGDVIATMIMTFSTFGFYGQIWFNRTFTYEAAVEEMPAGYAEGLMAVSPGWAFPVVVVIGLALSAVICNVTAKLFKLKK